MPTYYNARTGLPEEQNVMPAAPQAVAQNDVSPFIQQPWQQPASVVDNSFIPAPAQPMNVAYQQAQAQQPQQQMPAMIPVTETQVQSKLASPEAEKARQKAIAADAEAIAADKRASQLESQVTQAATQKVVGEIDFAKSEVNSALNELSGKKVIDPMEKWGTGKQIGAAIAMGLGAFASSFSGGKNHAAEIINSSIQRDIDMQEREMQRLGKNVDVKRNALAQAYNRLGDIAQAKDVVYQAALAGVSKDVEALASSAKSERVKANALALNSSLQGKRAEAIARTNETLVSSTTKQVASKSSEQQGLETPYGLAASKDAANTVRQKAMEHAESREGLAAFKKVVEKYGSWNLVPSEEKGVYQSALLPVINAYRVALNLGVLNPSERDKIESELKNKLSPKEATAFISGMERMIDMNEKATKKAYIVGTPYGSSTDSTSRTKQQLGFTK